MEKRKKNRKDGREDVIKEGREERIKRASKKISKYG